MNDINFIDITQDHLQLDLIFSEEHYQQEYKCFEQKHKLKSLESKPTKKQMPEQKKGLKRLKKQKSSPNFSIAHQEEKTQKSQIKQYKGKSSIILDEKEQITRFTLSQDTRFFIIWNFAIMFNGLYSAIAYPYFMVNQFPYQISDYTLWILILSETIYFIDIVFSFFKQDLDEGGKSKFESLEIIAKNYFQGQLMIDIITFLPLGYFFSLLDQRLKFIWIIKTMRISKLNNQLSDSKVLLLVENYIKGQQQIALDDPEQRKDTEIDRIYVQRKIWIVNLLKTIKLVFQMIFVAFLIGQFFFILSETIFQFTEDYAQQQIKDIEPKICPINDEACKLNEEELQSQNIEQSFTKDQRPNQDLNYFVMNGQSWNLIIMSGPKRVLINTYFAFTTLATVGFGDYYAVSIVERAIFTMIFLFGVALFSFIMGELQNMLKKIQSLQQDFNEESQLENFFNFLKKFNNGQSFDQNLREKITKHLNFRWQNNKNNFIIQSEDQFIYNELPKEVRIEIYSNFVFKNFLQTFRRLFSFRNEIFREVEHENYINDTKKQNLNVGITNKNIQKLRNKVKIIMEVKRAFLDFKKDEQRKIWTQEEIQAQIERFRKKVNEMQQKQLLDQKIKKKKKNQREYGFQKEPIIFPFLTFQNDEYSDFMTQIMHFLEISQILQGEIIAKELDDCNQILFVMDGRYDIGYEINKKIRYRKQFGSSTQIGGFQLCFLKRFQFIYRVHQDMICYSISRRNWCMIQNDHPIFYMAIKEKMLWHYTEHIYRPLMNMKNKDINQYEQRKDYLQILAFNDNNFIEMKQCMSIIKEEEKEKFNQRKHQRIDKQKNQWLIQTIEKKINLSMELSLLISFKLEYIQKIFWKKILLAVSLDKIQNPNEFIEEFYKIIFLTTSKIKNYRINFNLLNKEFKKRVVQLMSQSIKAFQACISKKYVAQYNENLKSTKQNFSQIDQYSPNQIIDSPLQEIIRASRAPSDLTLQSELTKFNQLNLYLQPFKNQRKISFFNNRQEILERDEQTGENMENDIISAENRKSESTQYWPKMIKSYKKEKQNNLIFHLDENNQQDLPIIIEQNNFINQDFQHSLIENINNQIRFNYNNYNIKSQRQSNFEEDQIYIQNNNRNNFQIKSNRFNNRNFMQGQGVQNNSLESQNIFNNSIEQNLIGQSKQKLKFQQNIQKIQNGLQIIENKNYKINK